VVLVASFICLCVLDGVAYTFGVFLDPLLVEMGGGRGQISSAGLHSLDRKMSSDILFSDVMGKVFVCLVLVTGTILYILYYIKL